MKPHLIPLKSLLLVEFHQKLREIFQPSPLSHRAKSPASRGRCPGCPGHGAGAGVGVAVRGRRVKAQAGTLGTGNSADGDLITGNDGNLHH